MAVVKTTTIRVSTRTRDALKAMASRSGVTADELVGQLVADADSARLLADASRDFDRMAAEPDKAAAYHGEAEEIRSFDSQAPAW